MEVWYLITVFNLSIQKIFKKDLFIYFFQKIGIGISLSFSAGVSLNEMLLLFSEKKKKKNIIKLSSADLLDKFRFAKVKISYSDMINK